jgi:hypothetical protein
MTDQVSSAVACRSCCAPIRFIETKGGRQMPVDPELIQTHLGPPSLGRARPRLMVLITERGEIRRGVEVSAFDPTGEAVEGYVSHWATCTAPAVHRKERA